MHLLEPRSRRGGLYASTTGHTPACPTDRRYIWRPERRRWAATARTTTACHGRTPRPDRRRPDPTQSDALPIRIAQSGPHSQCYLDGPHRAFWRSVSINFHRDNVNGKQPETLPAHHELYGGDQDGVLVL